MNESFDSSLLYDLDIKILSEPKVKENYNFPNEFSIKLDRFNTSLICKFIKMSQFYSNYLNVMPSVYVIDSLTGEPVKYDDNDFDQLSEVTLIEKTSNFFDHVFILQS